MSPSLNCRTIPDTWIASYNEDRHGRWCFGKTPTPTFFDAIPLAREKMIGPGGWVDDIDGSVLVRQYATRPSAVRWGRR